MRINNPVITKEKLFEKILNYGIINLVEKKLEINPIQILFTGRGMNFEFVLDPNLTQKQIIEIYYKLDESK